MIKKRRVEGLISANPAALTPLSLGTKYGRIVGIRARAYASSAKAAPAADTTLGLKIVDNNSDIVYLDAGTFDFSTERTVWPGADDTITGITATTGGVPVDQTGAAASAGAGHGLIAEGPVTVSVLGGATATDYMVVDLLVEVS